MQAFDIKIGEQFSFPIREGETQ